jgi:polysaccharide export outer membrane protein
MNAAGKDEVPMNTEGKAMTSMLRIVLLILTLSIATGAFAQDEKAAAPPEKAKQTNAMPPSAPADAQYLIGKEDILAVQVWREPELSRLVAVRPDGNISMPLVGELLAAGKTPLELQKKLTELLGDYMKSPEVSVIVQDTRSQRFSVLGEVMRPGSYPLSKPMTVLDALALAGGFRDFARSEKMFILRIEGDGIRRRIPVSYKKILSVNGTNQNVELQVHDTLVVP